MNLHSHRYTSVKLNLNLPRIFMVKIRFQNVKNSCFVHRDRCGVHVDLGTGQMLGWDQRIATRADVESFYDWLVSPCQITCGGHVLMVLVIVPCSAIHCCTMFDVILTSRVLCSFVAIVFLVVWRVFCFCFVLNSLEQTGHQIRYHRSSSNGNESIKITSVNVITNVNT